MDQPQERKYSFQTRVFTNIRCNAAYIPGIPTMSAPRSKDFETVAGFVKRYNRSKLVWESSVSSGGQVKLGITKENLRKLDQLEIPKGVNEDSWIKPSEDWLKENPKDRGNWESKIKNFRGGEEIIEAKALSDAFMNDPDSGVIHVTQHEKNPGPDRILYILEPTLGSGPSQPVLPPSQARQSVQPSLDTTGFLLAKPNPIPDLQRHSKLNDDPINPSTSSITPSQTRPGNSNPSSATPGATTRPVHGGNSNTDGGINQ
ncbi:uncharacterized protein Bfra_001291 [Botrytis fragariae]|uniref:Uncharacterized protein n=1 Tax=Botrytis fragariae TaxID=1964551 RepID=A0A8H6ELT9_9HELO|nr:uncharacterized protein Bfra_001291 [Botrytis fragariae]KAF5876933.1 hypothetical protein Bfra_001291 [Botrytis fragariae]